MREFNAMAEKIEAIDLERRAFLADVSHELRTPLDGNQRQRRNACATAPGKAKKWRRASQKLSLRKAID